MVAITVDRNGQGVFVSTGFFVQLDGFAFVVLAHLAALVFLVPVDDGGNPAISGGSGASEDLLGDRLAVDVHAEGLDQIFVVGQLFVFAGVGQGLVDARLADGPPAGQVVLPLVVGELVGWDEVVDVEIVGDGVVVGRAGVVVDLEGDLVYVALVRPGVIVIFATVMAVAVLSVTLYGPAPIGIFSHFLLVGSLRKASGSGAKAV